ncbi:SAM-dependent methyltransferase [Actinomycetospora corticicola]|nr:SAM-dependent methyltransferase [Actinomycetospora corticicola]
MEQAGPDPEQANAARMYDYLLGGRQNFAVDRALADEAIRSSPGMVAAVWAFRAFLRRTVRHCVAAGIDQFLDLGSGVPTVGNVHEIVLRDAPHARVAYVDHEPVAVAHARDLLGAEHRVSVTHADLRDVAGVLSAPTVRDLLDFDRPVAVLMLAVLHFLPDADDPASVVAAYRRHLQPGSAMVLSHGSDDVDDPELAERVRAGQRVYAQSTHPTVLRSRAELTSWFADLELVEPGLVDVARWRPDLTGEQPESIGAYGGLGLVR